MLFNEIAFVVFLPVVFLLYWAGSRRLQNMLLIGASYAFYAWWDWRFVGLLILSSAIDYCAGIGISRTERPGRRRTWLLLSVISQIGLLGFFKYLNFGIETLAELLHTLGFQPDLATLSLVLPVGISFYTFQTLSYTIDVYRRKIEPTTDAIDFFAFVSFFPQLVAGPIERASRLLGQFQRPRRFDAHLAADGCRQMLYGLFLKTVIADNCSRLVEPAFADPTGASGGALLLATYAFAFQIYGDFAGYSHIAIGCARLFGIDLMRNFAYPYFARSPAEFWRRWHISLSTWFRDYVYIPLGGSREGRLRTRINVLITFVVSGIWHGAGFTFVFWGLFHGVLVAFQWWERRFQVDEPGSATNLPRVGDVVAMVVTFHLACLGWVMFRASDMTVAAQVYAGIGEVVLQPGNLIEALRDRTAVLVCGLIVGVVLIEWSRRRKPHGLAIDEFPRVVRWGLYLACVVAIAALGRTDVVPFIYFQF